MRHSGVIFGGRVAARYRVLVTFGWMSGERKGSESVKGERGREGGGTFLTRTVTKTSV